jgi:replicative DNA helicase
MPTAATEVTERAPTHDLAAEQVVLGILMSDPSGVTNLAGSLVPDDFYSPKHGEIFKAILDIHASGAPVEPQALAAYLADRGDLGRLGGAPYLLECYQAVPVAAQLAFYADRVGDLSDVREWQSKGIQISQAATAPGRDLASVASLAQSLVSKSRRRRQALEMTELGSLINPALDDIEGRKHRKIGIKTGFSDLDRLLGGLRRKQLVTVAGATGMGKSVFLIDVARHVTIAQGLTAAFFTLEMSNDEVFERILAAEAGVNHDRIRDGELDERDWQKVSGRLGPMSNAPFFLSERAPMTVREMCDASQRLRDARGRLDVVFVDHMHLVKPSNPKIIEKRAIIENVSEGLKQDLAAALDIPVVAAAQLNRGPTTRSDKRPELSDLKDSSAVEQNSNVVILLHRDDYYKKDSERRGEADLCVEKNRAGRKDVVTVAAQLHLSRFVDMAIPG